MKLTLAVVVVFLCLATVIGGSYWLSLSAISQAERQWCATLSLLTAQPVPKPADPAANPSREQTYRFYINLVELRDRFGCA